MDATQHGPGSDDVFADVDFGDDSGQDGGVDFADEYGHDTIEQAVDDVMVDESVGPAATGSQPSAIETVLEAAGDTDTVDDEVAEPLATVTNPPETVSVTATMDGRVHRVELLADAARMTESELADEILVIADLARQQGLSIQHEILFEAFHKFGADDDTTLADMLENGVTELRSPEQAAAAQAEVFATRYTGDGR